MEKIVPMETFTSMLAEPSSGSYSTTYLPRGFPGGTGTGAWSSSEAVTHTRPVYCTLWRTVSLANRSSFCCRSPETFTAPAGPHRPRESGLDRHARIRLEQEPHRAVRHAQHHAVLVHVEWQRHPERIRAQHLQRDTVHLDPLTGARRMPARARLFYPCEKLEIQRPPQRLPRLEHQLGIERLHHGGHAAQVIGVAMRRHRHRHPAGALAPQERDHHTPSGIALGRAGARVDHDPTSVGGA